jgi:hypothetical protein
MAGLRAALLIVAAFAGAGTVMLPAGSARADRNHLQALVQLNPGRWQLRPRGGSGATGICLGADRRRLIQVRHPDLPCEWVVLEDGPSAVTVQYTCKGHGYGRTHIRRENSQLIQIETQGIADGLPFELNAEGRRIGECTP